jgi:hypothetical protein
MAGNTYNGFELLGTGLQQLLMADDIVPGAQPSYELCKNIMLFHPYGFKLAATPLQMAQFKPRKITVPKAPDDGKMLVEAFKREQKELRADQTIFNAALQGRVYGVSTLGLIVDGADPAEPVDFPKLYGAKIAFNVWDPLNTAGSLVLNQDPNAIDFLKVKGVSVNGKGYHISRACVIQNEFPVYIDYQSAGYGYVGRSIYQRGLVPLKSFVLTMATDMMIALKAGVLIAKMETQSSAVDGPMSWLFGSKRNMVKEATTGNVLSIGTAEDIESLNLQNLDGAYGMARKNIIENIASSCSTPARLLLEEAFANGFGEGDQDFMAIAQFVDGIRTWIDPLYAFFDEITMYRAWNEDFYATVQNRYPDEYGDIPYNVAFMEWRNSFTATWPSLLEEPESERSKAEDVKLKAIIAWVEVCGPLLDPENRALLIEWATNNLNEMSLLFTSPLEIDFEAIANYEPTPVAGEDGEDGPKPVSVRDSAPRRNNREMLDAMDDDIRRTAVAALRVVRGQAAADGGAV